MARGKLTERSLSLKAGGTNGRINAYPLLRAATVISHGGKPSLPVIRDLAKSLIYAGEAERLRTLHTTPHYQGYASSGRNAIPRSIHGERFA